MSFIGTNPLLSCDGIVINGIWVFFDKDDNVGEQFSAALQFLDRHGFAAWSTFYPAVYYLRGSKAKSEYKEILVGMQEVETLPPELYEIVHCIKFWNQEGEKCFAMNKDNGEDYRDFIIRCIAADCRAFVDPNAEKFITGRGSSHVWVTDRQTKQRILLIHF